MKSALLLSGGMDSTALAYWLRPEITLTLNYGQNAARGEIRAAAAVSEILSLEHQTIAVDLRALGSGDMAGSEPLSIAPVSEWWPFRNQMLVTLGAMKAAALGVTRLIIGCLKTDHHADGKKEFIDQLSALLQQQEGAMTLSAPAIEMTAVELIRNSRIPLDVLGWAHSCHVGEWACGLCRGCRKHYETLEQLGENPY
jgi:7-cyano-7-deazaguanine synthase